MEKGKPRGMELDSYKLYTESKKAFKREFRDAQDQYHDEQVKELTDHAEVDIGLFFTKQSETKGEKKKSRK